MLLPWGALQKGDSKVNNSTKLSSTENEKELLLSDNIPQSTVNAHTSFNSSQIYLLLSHNRSPINNIKAQIRFARSLFIPHMLPLLFVYTAEHTINQGITPTILFPLIKSPFSNYRSFYQAYTFLYQSGVLISRSSLPFISISSLLVPSLLQMLNLLLLTLQALFFFSPSVYIIFIIIFWEGLLGGATYINTFAAIMCDKQGEEREWSLRVTTASDSAGIMIAGLTGIMIEPWLCQWNVRSERPWCRDAGGIAG